MKARALAVVLAVSGLLACSRAASDGRAASTGTVSADSARGLAESAFLDATAHRVPKYAIELSEADEREWVFFAQGKDEYARPGFHWLVRVNKETGVTTVTPGE